MLNILSQFDIANLIPLVSRAPILRPKPQNLPMTQEIDHAITHTNALEEMLSMETAKSLAALIDPNKARPHQSTLSETHHKDTIYITVVDKDRMAVSLIYSIFESFGSGIATDRYGILFQNRGAGFNLTKGHANELKPETRPMHTIIPAMLRKEGKILMPFGVMGGQYQAVGHARVTSNMLDFGRSPQEAIDAPRCFSDDSVMKVERGVHQNQNFPIGAIP